MYNLQSADVITRLNTSIQTGLSLDQVAERKAQFGLNEVTERSPISSLEILRSQLNNLMVLILLLASLISVLLGDFKDGIAIFAIFVLNTTLGFIQDRKAHRAMEALRKLAVPEVRVRRENRVQKIPARELVPGDILLLEAGDKIPADARIVESGNLKTQEAALTGESTSVEKSSEAISGIVPLAERRNYVFSGTVISNGCAIAIVTETGMNTELGHIASMIQESKSEPTPLQVRTTALARLLAISAGIIVVIVSLIQFFSGERIKSIFLSSVSLAVAAVPEGLPTAVMITLAIGSQKMLKRGALIRKLVAVETLGSTTVICSDKTGTLTQNRMAVQSVQLTDQRRDVRSSDTVSADNQNFKLMLIGGSLCNQAVLQSGGSIGDPMEIALLEFAEAGGVNQTDIVAKFPRLIVLPFDSHRKRMSTIHFIHPTARSLHRLFEEGDQLIFTKGAVEHLLPLCNGAITVNGVEQISPEQLDKISKIQQELAQTGLRMIGLAIRILGERISVASIEEVEKELLFVGMFGLSDPIRPEAKEAVSKCLGAGIRPVMITGDHPSTAQAIAKELEIPNCDNIMTGNELSSISVSELEKHIDRLGVYARVSPEDKMKIVQAFQNKGEIVAMTGDGINDAPALKKANIGIAMGREGTDVAKEAADIVLLDDNFATIVAAVEEGRTIYDNTRKFMKYILAGNVGEICIMLVAPFLGMPIPLLPLQILWINLVTDGLPALALSVEPPEKDIMQRQPNPTREKAFHEIGGWQILINGVVIAFACILLGFWYFQNNRSQWQTIVFSTATIAQMGLALATGSAFEVHSKRKFFTNPALIAAVLFTLLLQLIITIVPFCREIFFTQPLAITDYVVVGIAATLLFAFFQMQKRFIKSSRSSSFDRLSGRLTKC